MSQLLSFVNWRPLGGSENRIFYTILVEPPHGKQCDMYDISNQQGYGVLRISRLPRLQDTQRPPRKTTNDPCRHLQIDRTNEWPFIWKWTYIKDFSFFAYAPAEKVGILGRKGKRYGKSNKRMDDATTSKGAEFNPNGLEGFSTMGACAERITAIVYSSWLWWRKKSIYGTMLHTGTWHAILQSGLFLSHQVIKVACASMQYRVSNTL